MIAPKTRPPEEPRSALQMMRSGVEFDLFHPRVELIAIEDIALGLSRTSHWRGQTRGEYAYSVAQHSIDVSLHVPPPDALWGLMHDGGEAYLTDVPRCWRRNLTVTVPVGDAFAVISYAAFEMRILSIVAARFGLAMPIPKTVIEADDRAQATEARDLFSDGYPAVRAKITAAPFAQHVTAWPEQRARGAFLERFRLLTKGE